MSVDAKNSSQLAQPVSATALTSFEDVLLSPPHAEDCLWAAERNLAPSPGTDLAPSLPNISLYCDECDGERYYGGYWIRSNADVFGDQAERARDEMAHRVAVYTCRNCEKSTVHMYLRLTPVSRVSNAWKSSIKKVGQDPSYRPRIPKRVQRLMGSNDWELYKKARTSEGLALGIAAFTYYRRVVEHVWERLIGKLIEVAKTTNEGGLITTLTDAKNNWRFSNAVEDVAPAIPSRLMIKGRNPLLLLHNAFSDGVHNLTDEQCLERARDGRIVLEVLLELIGEVLSEEAELAQAVLRLSAKRSAAPASAEAPAEADPAQSGDKV